LADNAEAWLEARTPWPEEFGLERMHALLAELGDPQRRFPAIHVVGTNGKTTATKRIEKLLTDAGLRTGATISPHIRGWAERITIDGHEADLEEAIARVRPAAEALGATQFEALIAAALAAFAAAEVDVAVVEAGLGGRLDATNVLDTRVVVVTNVQLEHTEWLGSTREAIAREKLAVVRPGAKVVLGEPEWAGLAREHGGEVVFAGEDQRALAEAAASAFAGRDLHLDGDVTVPGRFEWRGPDELRVGAHNPHGVAYLLTQVEPGPWTILAGIGADKDVDAMLAGLATLGTRLVATQSSSGRALEAAQLGERARRYFAEVETVPDPLAALGRARAHGGRLLVTGSLYLLADLAQAEELGLR
jgi:dihydrofolate synthase/folylpolyglutamate synthase